MRGPHNIWRLVRTGATFERTGAMQVVLDAVEAPQSLRLAARILGWPFKWLGLKGDPTMPPATRALTSLGPAYIKFGQILSTRPDVVGEDLALQLRVLQDKLPPFSIEQAKASFLEETGADPDVVFSDFSEPVAAASIAQVHKAHIRETDEQVAVKVLRPKIEKAFQKDIDAFNAKYPNNAIDKEYLKRSQKQHAKTSLGMREFGGVTISPKNMQDARVIMEDIDMLPWFLR